MLWYIPIVTFHIESKDIFWGSKRREHELPHVVSMVITWQNKLDIYVIKSIIHYLSIQNINNSIIPIVISKILKYNDQSG